MTSDAQKRDCLQYFQLHDAFMAEYDCFRSKCIYGRSFNLLDEKSDDF